MTDRDVFYPLVALMMAASFAPLWPWIALAALTPRARDDPSIRCNECRRLNAKRDRTFRRDALRVVRECNAFDVS
jgi:hypothetical protein